MGMYMGYLWYIYGIYLYIWYIYGIYTIYSCKLYHIIGIHHAIKNGKALFLWAIYTMAMLNSQRVYAIIPYYTMPYLGIYGDFANWGSPRWFRMDPKMDHLGCEASPKIHSGCQKSTNLNWIIPVIGG